MALGGSERFEVVCYIARQSLLSADHDASAMFPADVRIDSHFQRRMMTGDFAGDLDERLVGAAGETDVLLWDLADERHGVHVFDDGAVVEQDRKSTRLNSSHVAISYAVFCLKKKKYPIE